MIRIENLSFRYSHQPYLFQHFDLEIPLKRWVAITGGCGTGKSTLAKLICGLLEFDEGSITVELNQDNQSPRFGYLFQNPDDQFVHFNIEREVAFALENEGRPTDLVRKEVADTLRQLGLWQRRQDSPDNLSGGEKQKLALAGMIIDSPDILILDEPTSFLDIDARLDLYRIIYARRQFYNGIFWISQEANEIALAEHVIALDRGRLIFQGEPEQFLEQHPS